jgi:hypothetical protein
MKRLAVVAVVAVFALVAAGPEVHAADRPATLAVYGGLGSWLDIFAGSVWSRPRGLVAALRAEGVSTLYLQTSNYSQRADLVRPGALAALIDVGHAAGLRVVAGYLPSFAAPVLDVRRSLAAIRFRTATGQRFDSFALDIEASLVLDVRQRNARLLALAKVLRRAAPARYPLGAIIPSPVGMRHHPRYWPAFPYARLAAWFDAILPMAYFTHYTHTPAGAYSYAREVITSIRTNTDEPAKVIHLIGGLASGASTATFAAFDQAAADCGADGLSLYEFPLTTPPEWASLRDTPLGQAKHSACA